MQEHEYIYQYAQVPAHTSAQDLAQMDERSGQEEAEQMNEIAEGEVRIEDLNMLEEFAGIRDHRATLRLGRGLVVGLGLSFLACLVAFWLSGTLISAPDQLLPLVLLQTLAANRILVLCVPIVFLIVSYAGLRSLTGDIMAVPEHRLDERQKMLRDQAHRSAFKVIKYTCFLVPVAFLLPHLPWFNPATPPPVAPLPRFISFYWVDGNAGNHLHRALQVNMDMVIPLQLAPTIAPASTLEIGLAAGLLLLSLLLIVSALPMAVLAWKGKA